MNCARTLPVMVLVSLLNCQVCVRGMLKWNNSSAYEDNGGTRYGDERGLRDDILHGALVTVAIIITLGDVRGRVPPRYRQFWSLL